MLGKRIISALLALVLLLGNVPMAALAVQSSGSESTEQIQTASGPADVIPRAQWLQQLTLTFEMTVDEDGNYPDNYFSDLTSDSEYYYDVLLAVEFGVVDIPAGGAVRPDDPTTREFAAQTLNYCLGFQFEGTSYSFNDSALCTYPDDAQIAVDRSWLALADGAFCPEASITTAEKEVMLADAAEIYASQTIDPEFTSSYVFADHVVEFPYGTDVEIDENDTVTIYNADAMLTSGATFVVYPTELPALYQAVSVSGDTNVMVITTTEADEASAIVSINSEGMADMDISQFEAEEGVNAMYIQTDADIALAMDTYGISVSKGSVVAEKEISLSNGIKTKIVFNIANIKLNSRIHTAQDSYYVTVSGDTTLTGSVSVDAIQETIGQSSVTLGKARVAGIGEVTISVELALNGRITMTYTGGFEAGVQKDPSGFRLVKTFYKKTFSTVVEANASIGLKTNFAIDIIAAKANIYIVTGVAGKFVSNTYGDGQTPENCTNIKAWLFAQTGTSATVGIGEWKKTWSKDLSIYNESNSPARISFHYEDKVRVSTCSRGQASYTTADDSPYGSSFYGGGSSTGTSSSGEAYTIYTYDLDDENNATITGYQGNASALVIPETIDGYTVTAIGHSAFKENTNLYVVTIPSTVTVIDHYAFEKCTSLQSIFIPDTVIRIGVAAFKGTSLTSLVLPDNLRIMGARMLEDVKGVTELNIPKSVTETYSTYPDGYNGPLAYSYVETVIFENGMTRIPDYAAQNATHLTKVVIPDTVTTIDSHAFYACTNLKTISIPDTVTSIGAYAFAESGLTTLDLPPYLEKTGMRILCDCKGVTELVIPKTVTSLRADTVMAYGALHESYVEKLIFEDGITVIPSYAAADAIYLTEVTIPSSVTSIGEHAFDGCTSLQTLAIPDSVTKIDSHAFQSSGLEQVVLSDSVTEIGTYVFADCVGLTDITLPANRSEIPAYMFRGCTSLAKLTLPAAAEKIGIHAFENCTSLKELIWSPSIQTIDYNAFEGCSALTDVEIPETVTTLGHSVFYNCDGLTKATIPDTVAKTGDKLFYDCDALTDVTLGSGMTALPKSFFEHCDSLVSLELPRNITSIADSAFKNCVKFTTITIPPETTSIAANAFSYPAKMTIRGEAGSYAQTYAEGKNIAFEAIEFPAPEIPDPTPTEPKPTEPTPTEPKPTEPEPTKPTDPKPTDPEQTVPGDAALDAPAAKAFSVSSSGKPKVTWKAVDGAAKYQVYRATSKNGTYKKVLTTTNTSYTNTNAVTGKTYYYYVLAVAEDGTISEKSNTVSRTCDLPRPVITLSSNASTGKIKVSWKAIDGAQKYKVYRATSKNGTYKLVKTTDSTGYTHTGAVAGKTYYYKVKAIHEKSAANSAYSSSKYRTCDLPRPDVEISLKKGDPRLTWDKIDGAVEYKIYRSTTKDGKYTLVKTTTSTSYTNTKVKAGKTYYYKVRAIHTNTAANSAYSSIRSITAK